MPNPTQALSKEACALAADRAAAEAKGAGGAAAEGPLVPTTPAHMALLYSDAERTLPLLHDLGAEITTQQPSVRLRDHTRHTRRLHEITCYLIWNITINRTLCLTSTCNEH